MVKTLFLLCQLHLMSLFLGEQMQNPFLQTAVLSLAKRQPFAGGGGNNVWLATLPPLGGSVLWLGPFVPGLLLT